MPWKSKVHNPIPLGVRKQIAQVKSRQERACDPHHHLYAMSDWCDPRIGLRNARLSAEPNCRVCANQNIVAPAKEVDHIIPHRGDMELFMDFENTQSLCTRHHSIKTSKEKRR